MGIAKNDPKRWVLVRANIPGSGSFKSFGNLGPIGIQGLATRQPIVENYMTEDELEIEVNIIANNSTYYKDAVENESNEFLAPSQKY